MNTRTTRTFKERCVIAIVVVTLLIVTVLAALYGIVS